MSNLGLERYLAGLGLSLARTAVGDRYVLEHMREHGYNLGGEQSGHIILSDYATTGDGLVAALQLLAVVQRQGKPISEICHRFEPLPQILKNVRGQGPRGARSGARRDRHRGRAPAARCRRPAGHPAVRHRTRHPCHGRSRRPRTPRRRHRRHLRGPGGGVTRPPSNPVGSVLIGRRRQPRPSSSASAVSANWV